MPNKRLPRASGRPSKDDLNRLRVIPLHIRDGHARFLDRAADKAGVSRAHLVRLGSLRMASGILGEIIPDLETVGPGKKTPE
jgi:hypothetical protein